MPKPSAGPWTANWHKHAMLEDFVDSAPRTNSHRTTTQHFIFVPKTNKRRIVKNQRESQAKCFNVFKKPTSAELKKREKKKRRKEKEREKERKEEELEKMRRREEKKKKKERRVEEERKRSAGSRRRRNDSTSHEEAAALYGREMKMKFSLV